MHKLKAGAFKAVDGKLYFSSNEYNGLFELDMEAEMQDLLISLPGQAFSQRSCMMAVLKPEII